MKIYAKIFTQIFNDDWFISLNIGQRGLFLQLLVWAKMHGDTGVVHGRSMVGMGSAWGCDGKTCGNYLRKFRGDRKIALHINEKTGIFSLVIVNYRYYQGLDSKPGSFEDAQKALNLAEKSGKIPEKRENIYIPKSILREEKSRVEKSNLVNDAIFDPFPPKEESKQFEAIRLMWNEIIRTPIPEVKLMTPGREAKLRKRFKDSIPFGVDGGQWREYFKKVMESDFLSGRSKKWHCTFDWVIKSQEIVQKIMEGSYGQNLKAGPGRQRPEVGKDFGGSGKRQL